MASILAREFAYASFNLALSSTERSDLWPTGLPFANQLMWLDNGYLWTPFILIFLNPVYISKRRSDPRVCKIRCWLHRVKFINFEVGRTDIKKSLAWGTSIIIFPD